MKQIKRFSIVAITIFIVIISIISWRYAALDREVHNLKNQVAQDGQYIPRSIIDQNSKTDPPNGEADTNNWSVAEDTLGRFTLLYPDNWTTESSDHYIVVLKRLFEDGEYFDTALFPLSLMTSTNTRPSFRWREITLESGEEFYYSFEDGFDHYHVVNGDKMLTFSTPARSYDGLYTEQELKEAIQIINTYQAL